jgi:hypothetical protein
MMGAFWPALMENGPAGFVITPVGTPESAICTLPEKPFRPVTESVTGALEFPCAMLREEAERAREKSGCGGGGRVPPPPLPPPQPPEKINIAPRRKAEL